MVNVMKTTRNVRMMFQMFLQGRILAEYEHVNDAV